MSRRTAEASKAVRVAWANEQKLVSEGKGTRDWTPKQQEEILELGKAYYHSDDPDDVNDGKAFEGHHMKSAEAYPEYQGDPENIQFLSRIEHQEAHGGDYRNPTNGYFDPVKKVTHDFGDNIYEPCEVIELSKPIRVSGSPVQDADALNNKEEQVEYEVESEENTRQSNLENLDTRKEKVKKSAATGNASSKKYTAPHASDSKKGAGEILLKTIKKVVEFSQEHPIITGVFEIVGSIVFREGIKSIENNKSGDRTAKSDDSSYSDLLDMKDTSGDVSETRTNRHQEKIDYPDKRSSPKEHTVRKHPQRYHTKEGIIVKEKEAYPRGGKHDEE